MYEIRTSLMFSNHTLAKVTFKPATQNIKYLHFLKPYEVYSVHIALKILKCSQGYQNNYK